MSRRKFDRPSDLYGPWKAKARRPEPTATGSDVGGRCIACGRNIGYIEGALLLSARCGTCEGVMEGESYPLANYQSMRSTL